LKENGCTPLPCTLHADHYDAFNFIGTPQRPDTARRLRVKTKIHHNHSITYNSYSYTGEQEALHLDKRLSKNSKASHSHTLK